VHEGRTEREPCHALAPRRPGAPSGSGIPRARVDRPRGHGSASGRPPFLRPEVGRPWRTASGTW
jgi:hypothetical protein